MSLSLKSTVYRRDTPTKPEPVKATITNNDFSFTVDDTKEAIAKAVESSIPPIKTGVLAGSVTSPPTFDEDLMKSAINRAIAKNPKDFVEMLDCGSVYPLQARRICNELRLMGYIIQESPF
jgi:hypothetical protein